MKRFKYFIAEEHDYQMTYEKSHEGGTHFVHVTHKLDHKPTTREGVRGAVSRTEKHQELKNRGYKPHSIGSHDRDKKEYYSRPVKHTDE